MRQPPIIAAGDAIVDWLLVPPAGGRAPARLVARPSGALLVAEFLRQSIPQGVVTYPFEPSHPSAPGAFAQRLIELTRVTQASTRAATYRAGRRFDLSASVAPPSMPHDDAGAPVVVIADEGGAFLESRDRWPAALLDERAAPAIVLASTGGARRIEPFLKALRRHAGRTIVIVDADALREEANISRALSWERTAMELSWQLASNPVLRPLSECAHLIVTCGLDGAVHVPGGERPRLHYDPSAAEGEFTANRPDDAIGARQAFAAEIAAAVACAGIDETGGAVEPALRRARAVHRAGFGADADAVADVPRAGAAGERKDARLTAIDIPPHGAGTADPGYWRILAALSSRRLEQIAYDIVRRGDLDALAAVPVGRFGGLKTIDRAEIESFRSIQRLMASYCETENPGRPLSIAVFGQPGSGKSFGVSQVAQTVAPGRIEKREFNLSQCHSPADLVAAFHWVRDVALTGRIALAVFDEFDSALSGARLGWLKFFLAPMQDGAFKEGESMHPLGRAIFVFAGGTCSTYDAFAAGGEGFREAKGPDFVSRLRGYVDVLGPNPVDEHDRYHVVRRAVLLRSLLARKAPALLADDGAGIDAGVLRALIKVPAFKHGARSMEALLDMSALQDRETFDQSALPPAEQLDLHTDAALFSRLVSRDVVFGAGRERIARAIHDHYRETQKDAKPAGDKALLPWDELDEALKESNRHQADQIPEKLRIAGCGFAPAMNGESSFDGFTAAEIETLSEMEHERFVAERRADGWTAGSRDLDAKRTSYLVPWSELDEAVREYDRNAVRVIPQLMAAAGFEIYRLE